MTEKVSLKINGKNFQKWGQINLNLSLDSIDTFDFTTPMNVENIDFRGTFQPATYRSVEVLLNDEVVLTGVLNNKKTSLSSKDLSLGGYSLPGVLNDLPVPPDQYPLEFNNQTLAQIAVEMGSYYGVKAQFSHSPGAPFSESVSPEPAEKILAFLIKLAHKRSLLISNDARGKMLFFKPGKKAGITSLKQGELPLLDVQVDYDEQQLYDSVTGFGAVIIGRDPEKFTVPLRALSGVNRPFIYVVSDSQGADLQKAVEFKAGRLFASAIKISASVLGWRNAAGKIYAPGDFVSLYSPNNFFYNETKLLIRNVRLSKSGSDESASLDFVFPGVFSGELPKKLPWQ